LGFLDTIKTAGAHIKALEDQWLDTTTPHGELILTIMGGIAEFEAFLLPFGAPGEIPPCIGSGRSASPLTGNRCRSLSALHTAASAQVYRHSKARRMQ
jgi:hypothetical protein